MHQVPQMLAEAKRRGTPFWSKPVLFNWSDGPLLIAVAPVFRDAEMVGIVGAAVSTRTASDRLARLAGDQRPGSVRAHRRGPHPHAWHRIGRSRRFRRGAEWAGGAFLPSRSEFPDPVLAAMPWPLAAMRQRRARDRQPDDFAVDA